MATPADISSDPNTITNPGIPNFNILDVFQEFGYQPTQSEIDALAPSFEGSYDPAQIGTNAVAQYVNYQNQINAFNAKDPLTGIQTQMQTLITQNQASVTNLSNQLQSTLKSAPELFGSLTPDQISTYLQPLQTAFTQQLSQVQGTLASRGLGASSTEANALAQTAQQFQEQVLSTGLNIGLTSQQNQAQALQAQINNIYGQTNTAMGIQANAATTQSGTLLGESGLIASLPSFLNAQSAQEEQIATAAQKGKGFQGTFNQVTGDIQQGLDTAIPLASTATAAAQKLTGQTAPGVPSAAPSTPATAPSFASQQMGGSNYAPPTTSLFEGSPYNPYGSSVFGS